jgi:hypothetical protein
MDATDGSGRGRRAPKVTMMSCPMDNPRPRCGLCRQRVPNSWVSPDGNDGFRIKAHWGEFICPADPYFGSWNLRGRR